MRGSLACAYFPEQRVQVSADRYLMQAFTLCDGGGGFKPMVRTAPVRCVKTLVAG